MPRRSLRPHLNQIRAWVRQGRTDAWIAHQLEVTVRDIEQFKRQNELVGDDEPQNGVDASDYPEEIDLRAEDDALIAAELEAAEAEAEAEAERARAQEPDSDEETGAPRRRRSRRGGRSRSASGAGSVAARSSRGSSGRGAPLEGTFDHGEEGYGLWLDPAVQEDPIYAEHWAGHRPVEVIVEPDRIVIRRSSDDD